MRRSLVRGALVVVTAGLVVAFGVSGALGSQDTAHSDKHHQLLGDAVRPEHPAHPAASVFAAVKPERAPTRPAGSRLEWPAVLGGLSAAAAASVVRRSAAAGRVPVVSLAATRHPSRAPPLGVLS